MNGDGAPDPMMNSSSSNSRCPVQNQTSSPSSENVQKQSSFWNNMLQWNNNPSQSSSSSSMTTPTTNSFSMNGVVGNQMVATAEKGSDDTSKCPVMINDKEIDTKTGSMTVPASIEEAAKYEQTPQPDQRMMLGTHRQVSSIPRTDQNSSSTVSSTTDSPSIATTKTPITTTKTNTTPHHQLNVKNNEKWVYPSEQQLFNAMRRKGYNNVPEETIPIVLQIHNNINERTWNHIKDWENNSNIHLSKFIGRPKDMSPKAFFLSYIIRQYDPPFDRHDWYIQYNNTEDSNSNNEVKSNVSTTSITNRLMKPYEQRYVIDYYYLPPSDPNLPPIPYIDARPALDHPRALWLRTKRFVEDSLPGISTFIKERNSNTNNTTTNNQQQQQQDK